MSPPTNMLVTLTSLSGPVTSALYAQCEALLAYSLPLLGWLIASRAARSVRVAAVIALGLLLGHFLYRRPAYAADLAGVAVAHLYYLAASAGVYGLATHSSVAQWPRDALFACLLVVFVALPALPFRALGITPALVIGWFLVFSSYSYCVDSERDRDARTFAAFLFFAFVDPSLVYPARARRIATPTPKRRALARLALGLASLLFGQAVLECFPEIAHSLALGEAPLAVTLHTLATGVLCFLAIYWLRAGVVATKIALLELSGHSVRESYLQPYLAKSPRDFWSRWNLYVGGWARRYVFSPLALRLARRRSVTGPTQSIAPQAVAVIATFAAIGLLHDLLIFAGQSQSDLRFLRSFLIAGVGLLAWELCVLVLRRLDSLARAMRGLSTPARAIGMAAYLTAIATTLGAI